MADRCWQTVTYCGLPHRIRPEFWDNSGHRCGTAGVLEDFAARVTIDADGMLWVNHEHRATPSMLDPRTGWAMGNAGIVSGLLRFARARAGRDPAYAVPWPDHPGAHGPGLWNRHDS